MTEALNDGPPATDAPTDPVALSIALVTQSVALTRNTAAIESMRALAAALRTASLEHLTDDDARLAFWLNVYNALDRHAIVAENLRGNLVTKLGFFARAAYVIDRRSISLDAIEHGLLRANRRAPFALFRSLRERDPRVRWAPTHADPRVHFALNCGAKSCPPVRPYQPSTVRAELDAATREYFANECVIDRERRAVALPFLLRLYSADFGDRDATLAFAIEHLAPDESAWLRENRADVTVRFNRYDWTIHA